MNNRSDFVKAALVAPLMESAAYHRIPLDIRISLTVGQ